MHILWLIIIPKYIFYYTIYIRVFILDYIIVLYTLPARPVTLDINAKYTHWLCDLNDNS